MAKSPEGKARSSQNARTHGLFSRKLLVLPDESAEEYEAVRRGWWESYEPEGYHEERLIEQLILNDWLLRRACRRLLEAEAAKYDEQYEHRVELMQRYKTTAERAFYRAYGAAEALRKDQRQAWIKKRQLTEKAIDRNLRFRKNLREAGLEVKDAPPWAQAVKRDKFPRAG